MSFLEATYKDEIVFIINNANIDDSLVKRILSKSHACKKIGIDMRNVQNVNSSLLIKCLLENKIKLFNLQSEVLTYFAIILKDGFLKSYINYSDFSENKRELIKRRFLIA